MTDSIVNVADQLALDTEGRIAGDLSCLKCGYNLRGLEPNSACPECGTAIGRSAHGDLLRFCDPEWVRRLASGANWISAGIICSILGGGAAGGIGAATGLARGGWPASPVAAIISAVFGLVGLIGYWKVTTADPGKPQEESQISARSLVRLAMVTTFLLGPINASVAQFSPLWGSLLTILAGVVGLVGTVCIFVYARQLAFRIPDGQLASRTRVVMWGLLTMNFLTLLAAVAAMAFAAAVMTGPTTSPAGPATPSAGASAGMAASMGVGCVVLLGSLFFALWAIRLLDRFRKAFRQAAQLATETWARPAAL
jgi:hypothetical protein